MESVEEAWTRAQESERELLARLSGKDVTYQETESLIGRYRTACEEIIFRDFPFSVTKHVEARLWEAHGKINSRFRKILSRFREEHGKKKAAELRKLTKHYLDFIKNSQRFYRAFLQRLSRQYSGIPALEHLARTLRVEDPSAGQTPSPEVGRLLILSAHQSLIRLGDLSRYRETEIEGKDRNWGPAIGYYELAKVIYAKSGASHNQLAVIALQDGNHFRATYHLYRALSAEEPHPTAKGNLEIEFKKILAAWSRGEPLTRAGEKKDASKALLAWFVRLHARCYRGEEFAQLDELEKEVLSQLTVQVKDALPESTLQRIILINVAAEYFAGVRVQDEPGSKEHYQAFFLYLRLNVKTLYTLLQILHGEMDGAISSDGKGRVTAVTGRLLSGLRHYSTWLLVNSTILVAGVGDGRLHAQIEELWRAYVRALTLLAKAFPPARLPLTNCLLEEDEDTLGFKPFQADQSRSRYYDGEAVKGRCAGGMKNVELVRVRDLLADGVELAMKKDTPIALGEQGDFTYQERAEDENTVQVTEAESGQEETRPVIHVGEEESTRSLTKNLQEMVTLLVDTEVTEKNARTEVRTHTPRPSLPSIFNTPFALQPSEQMSPSLAAVYPGKGLGPGQEGEMESKSRRTSLTPSPSRFPAVAATMTRVSTGVSADGRDGVGYGYGVGYGEQTLSPYGYGSGYGYGYEQSEGYGYGQAREYERDAEAEERQEEERRREKEREREREMEWAPLCLS